LRSKPLYSLVITALLALAVIVAGCATAKVQRPVVADLGADDAGTQVEFWHTLAAKPVACNDDAFHAILLDVDGTDPNPDYPSRVSVLKARQLLLPSFNSPANEGVRRGVVAVAICKIANIKGGVIMQLTGPSERYCLRELQFDDLLPASSENQTFTGAELVGVIGELEDYMNGNPNDYPAVVMPPPVPVNSSSLKAQQK
jgi:hypothetical protein